MITSIQEEFLNQMDREALALEQRSDVLQIRRFLTGCEGTWLARLDIPYLVQRPDASFDLAAGPVTVGIRFGPDYLREVSPLGVVQVQQMDLFHPNFRWPVLCVGDIRPGMPLAQLLRLVWEILTYQNFATDDGLNPEACQVFREQPWVLDLLPRHGGLIRRQLQLEEE